MPFIALVYIYNLFNLHNIYFNFKKLINNVLCNIMSNTFSHFAQNLKYVFFNVQNSINAFNRI